MTLTVAELNALPVPQAREAFAACCGSAAWVAAMMAHRPFATRDALLRTADAEWARLTEPDWREAFSHHPRIGERRAAATVDATARQWSTDEQARAMETSAAVRADLAHAQQEYEARFGHIFLICAAGRSAAEILAALRQRMTNDPTSELRVAAEEQRKITRLRLEKLVAVEQPVSSPAR